MTWNHESVSKKVLEVFGAHNHIGGEVSEESQIVADLGIDSLGVMEVLADIEDAFKLQIPDDALRDINTVGDVLGAILSRLEKDGRLSA